MHDAASITFRLESYLLRLSQIIHRWNLWLKSSEEAIVKNDVHLLPAQLSSMQELIREAADMQSDRTAILNDAEVQGFPAPNLTVLARSLPAWRTPALRRSLATARSQIAQLQRMHVATWVLMQNALQYQVDMLQVLSDGNARKSVYTASPQSDTGGGRLLDASL